MADEKEFFSLSAKGVDFKQAGMIFLSMCESSPTSKRLRTLLASAIGHLAKGKSRNELAAGLYNLCLLALSDDGLDTLREKFSRTEADQDETEKPIGNPWKQMSFQLDEMVANAQAIIKKTLREKDLMAQENPNGMALAELAIKTAAGHVEFLEKEWQRLNGDSD